MFEPAIDPVHWSTKAIISLGDEVIHELAKRASATVNAYKLTVGRCLLAVERSKLHQRMGYSGAIHYAVMVLGLGKKKACELRRVARELEELPKLSKAAELGQVGWGKLRVIVSKATMETEDFWLGIAPLRTCDEIEKLAASTERGKLPWESPETPEPLTRFQFHLGAVAGELFERVIQAVSQENEKPMSAGEVIEHLAIERLAKRPLTPEIIEATREEARRGNSAAKHRHARLIQEARQLVEDCGLREHDSKDPLAIALGADSFDAGHGALFVARELNKEAPIEILEIGIDAGDQGDGSCDERASVATRGGDPQADDEGLPKREGDPGAVCRCDTETGVVSKMQDPDIGGEPAMSSGEGASFAPRAEGLEQDPVVRSSPPVVPYESEELCSSALPERPVRDEASGPAVQPEHPVRDETSGPAVQPERPVLDETSGPAVQPERPVRDETSGPAAQPERPVRDETSGPAVQPERPVRDETSGPAVQPEHPVRDEASGPAGQPEHPVRDEASGPEPLDSSSENDEAPPALGALIERALKEKRFFLELQNDDWRNNRIRMNPEARSLTPAQRKELLRRDGYCCSNPGCPNRLWLEFHHIVAVSRKGKTVRYNLMALCSRCHRNVHRGFPQDYG